MKKIRVIKVFTCFYGDEALYEDKDWCIVHSSKRIPGQEICEEVRRYAIEESKKPAPAL